jgi:hypothetical protein
MARWLTSLLRLSLAVPLAVTSLGSATAAPAHAAKPDLLHGADISWPSCPKGEGIPSRRSQGEPMPKSSARFVIVGVTNGPGFHPNPCLASQFSWVESHHRLLTAYALTTFPSKQEIRQYGAFGAFSSSTRTGKLRNAGYAEASYNVATMSSVGMSVPMIWVDVEPYPTSPWRSSHQGNRAVLTGVIRGYREAGYRVGIYTYARGWDNVVGGWRVKKYPTWSTAGPSSPRKALSMCTHGTSGGPTWLVQRWSGRRDYDTVCPKAKRDDTLMFSQPVR